MIRVINIRTLKYALATLLVATFLAIIWALPAAAQQNDTGFSLQVAPSPLVATVEPGANTQLELKIRNTNTVSENLQMGLRSFGINDKGDIKLQNDTPKDIAGFVTFQDPSFTLKAGEWFTQKININTPKEAGFSYSFAVTISRQDQNTDISGTNLKGSVAVFTLLNIDRPGAERKFEITDFKSTKKVYQYLPATFNITFKNTGNTLVKPVGNLFITRDNQEDSQISSIPINPSSGYILPQKSRTLNLEWTDGFPEYETTVDENGNSKTKLTWNWQDASSIRFGKYNAKVVAIYNDGQHDVPLESTVTFWVIPWQLMLATLVVFGLLAVGLIAIVKFIYKLIKKNVKHHKKDISKD